MSNEPEGPNGETEDDYGVAFADGAAYVENPHGLCKRLGVVAMTVYEGELYAYVYGKGKIALSDLVKEENKKQRAGNVVGIIK